MKKTLLTLLLGVSAISTAQITTSSNYTADQLVNSVLMSNEGVTATNITSSSAINFGSTHSLGYFSQNGSSFPFQDGIILSTGSIDNAPGPNTTSQSTGNWPGDADIQAVMNQYGNATPQNATSISFEFLAPSTVFTFDYVFASEEYGTYQCSSNDAIAFILTDLDTDESMNIAYLPGTIIPVSVWSVRNAQYNSGCSEANPEFFDQYYDPSNSSAPINFNGSTVPVSATADLTPGHNYRLKIIIADGNDSAFDSALFIAGGSFSFDENPYSLETGNPNDLYACEPYNGDQVAEFNLTANDEAVLNGLNPEEYIITYYNGTSFNDPIPNPVQYTNLANGQVIGVKVTQNANPQNFGFETFTLNLLLQPQANTVNPVIILDNDLDGIVETDLTATEVQILNGQPGEILSINYYLTEEDAANNVNPIASPQAYTTASTTIYYRISSYDICNVINSFEIVVLPADYETPAPSGDSVQTFTEGETLADIELEGENIHWYATAGGEAGRSDDTPLPIDTPLVNNTTYYASQNIYGIESTERLPVTVNAVLNTTNNTFASLKVYPNPVSDVLTIENNESISTIAIYNLLGQQVFVKTIDNDHALLDISSFSEGMYIVKIKSSQNEKVLKISKK